MRDHKKVLSTISIMKPVLGRTTLGVFRLSLIELVLLFINRGSEGSEVECRGSEDD